MCTRSCSRASSPVAQARLPQSLLLWTEILGEYSSFGSMMTTSLQNTVVLAPGGLEISGKHSSPGTVRPQTPAKYNSSGTMRTKILENTVLDPNPLKIQQFWFHSRSKSLENTAVLVPQQTETLGRYSRFGSTPKSLENTAVLVSQ